MNQSNKKYIEIEQDLPTQNYTKIN